MADLPQGWTERTIESVMERIIDYRGRTPPKTTSGIPLVTAKIIKGGRLLEVNEYIPEGMYDEWMSRGLPQRGDVVITTEAPMGEVAQLDTDRVALAQRVILLRGKPGELDNTFLRFALMSSTVQQRLQARLTGTTVTGIKQKELRQVLLPVPGYREQRRIAAVLGALDDKIELNRKMNRTLEEMAQALFKSWFIDFDGHEDFEESELGPIPRGWTVGVPSALVEFDPRVQIQKGAEVTFVEMRAVPTAGPSIEFSECRAFTSGSKFEQGDTLLARITPCLENGKTALVDVLTDGEPGFGSTEFIVMRGRPGVPPQWVYCLARSDFFRAHAITNMTGSSGRQRVPASCFDHLFLALPPPEVLPDLLQRFGEIAGPLFERISANAKESRTLSQLRDLLLPKLISGELRVPESLPLP